MSRSRRALLLSTLAALLGPVVPLSAEPLPPEDRARARLVAPRPAAFVGEVLPIALEVEVDLAWFAAHAVPLFQRPLDLSLKVDVPGWEGGADLRALRTLPPAAGAVTRSFALGDDVVPAQQVGLEERAGRRVARLRVVRRFEVLRAGAAVLGPPTLRFAWAETFREGLFGERLPEGTHPVQTQGAALALSSRPLPEAGRPAAWQGALGRFTLAASVAPDECAVGEHLTLTLHLAGEGNWETLPTPQLSGLEGFHVFGTLDPGGDGPRTLTYSIAPLSADLSAVPALRWSTFDPQEPSGYRDLLTTPLPLTVRPAPAVAPPAPPETSRSGPPPWLWGVAAALLVALLRLALRRRTRPTA